MSRTRVKICGLTRLEDAALAVDLGADAIGFVLWPNSPRAVPTERAAAIAAALPSFVTRVGVFVNATPDEVGRAVEMIGLDVAQLHGDEAVAPYVGRAPRLLKVMALGDDGAAEAARALPSAVTVLVDAADRERRGGTGQRADWTRAAVLARARPVVLAGGISADNVREALRAVHPWAIDVSSGVEAAPGVKSPEKLRALFRAVQGEQA